MKTVGDVEVGALAAAKMSNSAPALLERIAAALGGKASAAAVYGEPIERGDITVIPVARVGFGFGGGAGRRLGRATEGTRKLGRAANGGDEAASERAARSAQAGQPGEIGDGGGGGGGVSATPIGYIEIKDGSAVFKRIHNPLIETVLPLAILVAGFTAARIIRTIRKSR